MSIYEVDQVERDRLTLSDKTTIVATLRESPLLHQLIKSFRTSKRYAIDEGAITDEIQEILSVTAVKAFRLEGVQGLKDAVGYRFGLNGGRDRLVRINRELRGVLTLTQRIWRTGLTFIRSQPETAGVTVKALEDIAAITLIEIHDTICVCDRLMSDTKEALTNMDDRTKLLDSWFSLHKQYTFLTLSKGPKDDGDQESNLGRRSRQ